MQQARLSAVALPNGSDMDKSDSTPIAVEADIFMKVQAIGGIVLLVVAAGVLFAPLSLPPGWRLLSVLAILLGLWASVWSLLLTSRSFRVEGGVLRWRAWLARGQFPVASIRCIRANRFQPWRGTKKLIRVETATGLAQMMESTELRSFVRALGDANPHIRIEKWW